MQIQVLKSKIHRVRVTQADLNYIGSITIDEELMNAANLIENEQVHVLNYRNGERIVTYVIKGKRGSGVICLNGPAALKFNPGDDVIVLSYAVMEFEAAKKFNPVVIFPDTGNNNKLKS
ncbi:MAG: aspartate 1-decarboxylase [Bacteroidetes bacterium]|nr:aspartate 1-decarboxylase [Bacteroidota bacterium]